MWQITGISCGSTYTKAVWEGLRVDSAQHTQLVNFIWGIADGELRDVYVEGKYRDVIPSLPSIEIDDLTDGILQSVDLDSYRAEKLEAMKIGLEGTDATIDPPQDGVGGVIPEPELDRLSAIVQLFNEQFGNIDWKDEDRIRKVVTEEIPALVAQDSAVKHALVQGDVQKIRIELARAVQGIMGNYVADDSDLFKHYADDAGFQRGMLEMIFRAVYQPSAG